MHSHTRTMHGHERPAYAPNRDSPPRRATPSQAAQPLRRMIKLRATRGKINLSKSGLSEIRLSGDQLFVFNAPKPTPTYNDPTEPCIIAKPDALTGAQMAAFASSAGRDCRVMAFHNFFFGPTARCIKTWQRRNARPLRLSQEHPGR